MSFSSTPNNMENLTYEEMKRQVILQESKVPNNPVQRTFPLALAGRKERLIATIVDFVLSVFAFFLGAGAAQTLVLQDPVEETNALLFGCWLLLPCMMLRVFQWYQIATTGQSIGKFLLRVKIVVEGNRPPGFIRGVLLRSWVIEFLSSIPFFALIDVMFIFNDDHKCLHDHLSGTRVVDCSV